MTINDEINKYKEIIKTADIKKRKYMEDVIKYLNEFSISDKNNKEYFISNLFQILILLEAINQSVEDTKLKLETTYIRRRFRSKFYTNISRFEDIFYSNTYQNQYKIELYKLMSMEEMDTIEYEEQLLLVKKYKELAMNKK